MDWNASARQWKTTKRWYLLVCTVVYSGGWFSCLLLSPALSCPPLPSPVISPVVAVTASGRQTLPCHVRGLWCWSVLMESALSLFVNLKHWHVTAPPGRGTVCHSDACWYIHFEYSEFFSFVVLIAFPPPTYVPIENCKEKKKLQINK